MRVHVTGMGARRKRLVTMIALLAACALGAAHLAFAGETPSGKRRACVAALTEVRPAAGKYEHWVHLINACSVPMTCTVRASSNPEAMVVPLRVREQYSVMMSKDSAAREFSARVSCHVQD